MEGGEWNIGCWIFKTHGGWVRVGECGFVFEVVVALTRLWPCGLTVSCGITGACGIAGVVWNKSGRVE